MFALGGGVVNLLADRPLENSSIFFGEKVADLAMETLKI
jgi:hypothetical protein